MSAEKYGLTFNERMRLRIRKEFNRYRRCPECGQKDYGPRVPLLWQVHEAPPSSRHAPVLTDRWWRDVKRKTVWRIEGRLLSWTVTADENSRRSDLLAECDCGDFYVPSRTREAWWDRLWCWWKPTHWPVYLRSRRARAYVMIEHGDGAS